MSGLPCGTINALRPNSVNYSDSYSDKCTSGRMSVEYEKLMKDLISVEEAAQKVIMKKELTIELDRKRNKAREAQRALEIELKERPMENKTWMCVGNMFLKLPKCKAIAQLKNEQTEYTKEIDDMRDQMKTQVDLLRNLEGKTSLKGFNLNSMSKTEIQCLEKILNQV